MGKRVISLLLILAMFALFIPGTVFAESSENLTNRAEDEYFEKSKTTASNDANSPNVREIRKSGNNGNPVPASMCELVGGDEYSSVQKAIDESEKGQTVKLLDNVCEKITVASDKEIILDLNGMTLSSDGITVTNEGNLTVTDSSQTHSGRVITDNNYDTDYIYTVLNQPDAILNISGGTFEIVNSTAENRAIISNLGALYILGDYTVITCEVEAGTAEELIAVFNNAGSTCIISGGFVCAKGGNAVNFAVVDFDEPSIVHISGGFFIGHILADSVTGGKFTENPSDTINTLTHYVKNIDETPYIYTVVAYEEAVAEFNKYKYNKKIELDSLGDDVSEIIKNAKTEIDGTVCDNTKSLAENKKTIDAIVEIVTVNLNEARFNIYKNEKKADLDRIGDDTEDIIKNAKSAIDNLQYDSGKNFDSNKAAVDEIADLVVPNLNTARFNAYKEEKKDTLDKLGDDEADIINNAKIEIDGLSYNTKKSLDENKYTVDTIVKAAASNLYETKFNVYKQAKKSDLDSLGEDVSGVIKNAKAALDNLNYNTDKSLDGNKASVDTIVNAVALNLDKAKFKIYKDEKKILLDELGEDINGMLENYKAQLDVFEYNESLTLSENYAVVDYIINEISDEYAKAKISYNPEIINGANQSIDVRQSGAVASFRSNADFSEFVKVKVDGQTVSAKDYDAAEGSIIITLKESYLNTLTPGEHSISIISTNGHADTTFSIISDETVTEEETTENITEEITEAETQAETESEIETETESETREITEDTTYSDAETSAEEATTEAETEEASYVTTETDEETTASAADESTTEAFTTAPSYKNNDKKTESEEPTWLLALVSTIALLIAIFFIGCYYYYRDGRISGKLFDIIYTGFPTYR